MKTRHMVLEGARVTSPAPRQVWQALFGDAPRSLVTHSPTWLDCVCHDGSFEDASRLYEFPGGRRVILPLARRRRLPAHLAVEACWPSDWGVGGVVTGGETPSLEEARAVFCDLAGRPALRTYIRFGPLTDPVWAAAAPPDRTVAELTAHILDLDGGFDRIWEQRFRGSVRRAVRKAERSAIDIEVDRTGRLVPAFYHLYEQSIVRWAEQQHEPLALSRWRQGRMNPPRKFAAVAERFGTSCAIWVARCSGVPVAAIIVLQQGAHAKYWRGAMDKELASPVRANDLLHRLAIEDACAAGCRYYYMGDSRAASPLARFKEGFGAVPHPTWAYLRERVPISAAERRLRGAVKRILRFQDV